MATTNRATEYTARSSPEAVMDNSCPPGSTDGPSCSSTHTMAIGIHCPTDLYAGMTICSTASIHASAATTKVIWLRTSEPMATPTTAYTASTTNPTVTVSQKRAPTATSPPRDLIVATAKGTATARVSVLITALATARATHFAASTRRRRGSTRYVGVTVP